MSRRLGVVAPWILLALVLASWAVAMAFDGRSHEVTSSLDRLWAGSFLAFPAVGAFLVSRVPKNPVGWLFLFGPLGVGAGVAMNEAGEALDLSGLIGWGNAVFQFGLLALFASILLFPDGRYPQRRWVWFHALALLLVPAGYLFFQGGETFLAANPLLAVVALGWRMITGNATTRRQIAAPVVVTFVGVVILLTQALLPIDPDSAARNIIVVGATVLLTVGIPVAIAISITRYRLYEIDRIISRTVSYASLSAVLIGVYVGLIFLLRELLPFRGPLPVAASTLAAAALFNPLRRRLQHWVDRRFNRARYDAALVIEEFSHQLRSDLGLDEVGAELESVAAQTMHPRTVSLWLLKRS